MGPKRKPGPKSRKRKASTSSEDSSSDSFDSISIKRESKLAKEETEVLECADDFSPLYRNPNRSSVPAPPRLALEGQPGYEYHVCLMSSISQLKDNTASKQCVRGAPLKVKVADIPTHYYLHYRDRNYWDKFVAPITEEEKKYNRWESFQCKICDYKWKVRTGSDPDSCRFSFCFHIAIYHGKIIEAMQEDNKVDMEPVLEILKKHDSALRRFIEEGTDDTYTGSPCIARESCDWKMRQGSNPKQIVSAGGGRVPPISNATNPVHSYHLNTDSGESWACPFNDRTDCKNPAHEKSATNLKIHLYNHYYDFWSDIVPEMTSKKVKCQDCGKPVSGETLDACRNAMICHRAIVHNELKQAIEEGIRDFDADLFDRLFNQEAVKPPQVNGSRQNAQPRNQANQEMRIVDVRSKSAILANKPVPNQPLLAVKSTGWLDSDSNSEDEDDPAIPVKPYVSARIKQNLVGINFSDHDDDSDLDEEFKFSETAKLEVNVAPRTLPNRNRRTIKQSPDSIEDSE